jgi:glycosyltransferase involved in cell wall biosynthesis
VTEPVRIAMRLLLSGDLPELTRRIRVRLLGNARIPAPALEVAQARPGKRRPASGPVKALMFAHNLNREGAPISQFEMTRGLIERGVLAPEVVAFTDGPLRQAYCELGVAVTVLPPYLERIATWGRLERVVDELVAFIRLRRPDVVYANTLLMFVPVLAACRAGVPSLLNCRESEPWETYFGFLGRRVAQEALKSLTLPEQVIFVSEASRQVWSRFDVNGRFSVIRNGIPPPRVDSARQGWSSTDRRACARKALAVPEGDVLFVCVGTLCERKGQLDLIEAFSIVPDTAAAQMLLWLVGDEEPQYGARLRARLAALSPGRQARIRLLEATPDIATHYAAADVLVHCARVESYPRVILEAMAYGLPIVATPVFGVVEQVREGHNAYFFPPGDHRTLADRMELLSTDRLLRERLGRGSLSRLAELDSFQMMLDGYAAAFERTRSSSE